MYKKISELFSADFLSIYSRFNANTNMGTTERIYKLYFYPSEKKSQCTQPMRIRTKKTFGNSSVQ